ncbi:hypothetical protein [Streptomyces sp. BBFR109]|uniref:hypothetical protein n=1 Tax=Streptomyces sp. BBFR109 TaxID=3448172 RepID=UPI003F76399F
MTDSPDRFHLQLTSGGRPVQHGWWRDETTARSKFAGWVGKHGDLSEPRVVLVDEVTGQELAAWP